MLHNGTESERKRHAAAKSRQSTLPNAMPPFLHSARAVVSNETKSNSALLTRCDPTERTVAANKRGVP